MTIAEVEERTGLTRSNIRFYEKEGLLKPSREKSSGYRNYSEEDVDCIQKIAFLRTLGISVENIGKIISGKLSLYQTVERQSKKLQENLKAAEASALACEKLLKSGPVSFEELDVEQYTTETEDYWERGKSALRYDFAGLLRRLGSFKTWRILFFLSLLVSILVYPGLPAEIPIQWNQGAAVTMGSREGIFVYPVVTIVWRMILIPYLYVTLGNSLHGGLIAEYAVNGICFAGLTVEIFTVFYSYGYITIGVFPILAVDAGVLLILLALGLKELNQNIRQTSEYRK